MIVNGKKIDVNKLTEEVMNEKTILIKRKNNIYLSDNDINILNKYNINYNNYNFLSDLIFDIEEILNYESDLDDLENLSDKLSELNYYNNTNK